MQTTVMRIQARPVTASFPVVPLSPCRSSGDFVLVSTPENCVATPSGIQPASRERFEIGAKSAGYYSKILAAGEQKAQRFVDNLFSPRRPS